MMTSQFCEHFHEDCGDGLCFAVADKLYGEKKNRLLPKDLHSYTRKCCCSGNEKICEFKLFGVKEARPK